MTVPGMTSLPTSERHFPPGLRSFRPGGLFVPSEVLRRFGTPFHEQVKVRICCGLAVFRCGTDSQRRFHQFWSGR